ncbi:fibroblast growth factor 4A [Callorhinchus milii]|nr:fibroblast growth factor 4A [Callorhinchus milii]|eukprot:gi/632971826/ref/XP_007902361.1/ PREDICTED: fibroblast growth factor 6 [Callorhinchus milii]
MSIVQRQLLTMSFKAPIHWTLAALALLALQAGTIDMYPLTARTNRTSGTHWQTLLSRSMVGISGHNAELNWDSPDYLLGIKRLRRLYCNVGIGFHLQILPDARINGVHSESQYSLLQISTASRGVVTLYGLKSGLFVAMNNKGRLYGTVNFHDECKFRETLLPNNYNAYESEVHKGMYIALSKHGKLKKGNRVSTKMSVTHFLPRL